MDYVDYLDCCLLFEDVFSFKVPIKQMAEFLSFPAITPDNVKS